MFKTGLAFILTLVAGILGLIIGKSMGVEGYLGVFLSIATVGAFIVHSLEEKSKK